ncbi:amino acid transporter [Paxillus ammoniavirescens]|nr:amino acid transporter [Paxillus ammoniavirescens]
MARPHDIANKLSDETILAGLGYRQEFRRAFTPLQVFGIAFSVIGLLPSIASVLASAASNGGAVAMVWGWAFATCFILCIGMSLGELASSAPTSGGLYYLTYTLASPRTRNILCWIVGYASTIGTIAGIEAASIDWGCAVQITAAASIGSDQQFVATDAQAYGIYAAIVVSQAIVCSLGTKILARLQTLYVICNVLLCIVVIVALPVATPAELKNSPSYVFGNFTNVSGWPDVFAFILGLLAPLWTISGYDATIHISEEASNAALAVPWGMVSGNSSLLVPVVNTQLEKVSAIAIAGVLGWAINVTLAFYMGTDLTNIISSPVGQPMAQIFLNSFGKTWTLVIWSFVVLVQYMMGSSQLLAASRQSFAFARDGALPLSDLLYRFNKYTGTPVNTVWFDSLMALLVGLLALSGPAAVSAVFSISVTAQYVAFMTPIIARFAFENNFKPGPFSLGVLSAPIAAIAVVFMMMMMVVLCFPSAPQPQVPSMNYTSVVLGGVMTLAMIWYYFPVYGGVHWFQGPVPNTRANHGRRSMENDAETADAGLVLDDGEKESADNMFQPRDR